MNFLFLYRCLKARIRDQRHELKALSNHLGSNHLAVDVGANKGSYLLSMSKAVKEGGVVAFEPQPILADYLRRVVRDLRPSNVTIENMGVSSVMGVMDLNIPGPVATSPSASFEKSVHSDNEFQSYEVSVTTLDDYFAKITQQLGAIKIDVEGHELSVLQGAEEIIKHHSPLIICESESRHLPNGDVNESLEYFREIGYGGFFVHPRKGLIDLDRFLPRIHQRQEGERFWDSRDYCNNFILNRR